MTRPVSDIQLLRAFVSVARTGNVSRASEALALSQPAVSLQLKALGQATGLQLFNRKAKGLEVTAQGLSLLPYAERALDALAEFNRASSALQEEVVGLLRVGTILDPEFTRLGVFLSELVESAPRATFELSQHMSGAALQEIEKGQLDVAFYLADPEVELKGAENALVFQPLTRFNYCVVAPPGWGPRVKGRDWQDLASLPWLGTPPHSVHHRLLSRVFGQNTSTPTELSRVALVDQEASMIDLVKSGVGLSLMRESIAIREHQAHGVEILRGLKLECLLVFVCQKSRRAEPVIASAFSALERAWNWEPGPT